VPAAAAEPVDIRTNRPESRRPCEMDALRELFTTWIGLLSLGVIVGIGVIALVMFRWIGAQVARDEAKQLNPPR